MVRKNHIGHLSVVLYINEINKTFTTGHFKYYQEYDCSVFLETKYTKIEHIFRN